MSPPQDTGPTIRSRKPRHLSSLLSARPPKEGPPNPRWAHSKSAAHLADIKPPSVNPRKPAELSREELASLEGTMDRRQSKMTLFDLFSKPKVERARGILDPVLESLPARSETPVLMIRPASRASSTRAPSLIAGPNKLEKPYNDWDPPPLFQAYPQAVKHGALDGTNLSTETVLQARQASYRYQETVVVPGAMMLLRDEKLQNDAARHDAGFSTATGFLGIGEKVFVLTTTGRLLQYPGKGNYDRQPEKILQLCHTSAAFACDLIPGKHWVLQIVRSTNQDGGAPIKQSRSILSRFKASGASRKNATSMLMIFSSPQDMDDWLKSLRKSIEQLGGRKIEPDPGPRPDKRQTEANSPTEIPSHRYQIQRHPYQPQPLKTDGRLQSENSTRNNSFHLPIEQPPARQVQSREFAVQSSPSDSSQTNTVDRSTRTSRVSHATSVEGASGATTALSGDQIRLDQQRDSSRHSLISTRTSRTSETEAATVPTSRGSSSPPSPLKESFKDADTQRSPAGVKSSTSQKPRRVSTQTQPMPRASQQWLQKEVAIPSAQMQWSPNDFPSPPTSQTQLTPNDFPSPPTSQMQWIQRESPNSQSQWMPKEPPSSQRPEDAPAPSLVVSEPPVSYVQDLQSKPVERDSLRVSAAESTERSNSLTVESEDGTTSTRPTSTIGQLPNLSQRSLGRYEQRTDPPRKLFMKPIPVKPLPVRPSDPNSTPPRRASGNPETLRSSFTPGQARTTDAIVSRQHASFPVTAGVATGFHARERMSFGPLPPVRTSFSRPLTLRTNAPPASTNTTILTTEPSPTLATKSSPTNPSPTTAKALRRPASMQIRSDPAPFLSSRQLQSRSRSSMRSSSASPMTPGAPFASGATPPAMHTSLFSASLVSLHPGSVAPPPIPPMNPNRPAVKNRVSMATIVAPGMPPPAHPPPNIPLPKLPTSQPVS